MNAIGLLMTLALGLLVAPLISEAQPPTHVHRIGWLANPTPGRGPLASGQKSSAEAFLEEMRALGYVEGQNLVMEYRAAEWQYERFPALAEATEMLRLYRVAGCVGTPGGTGPLWRADSS